MADSGGMRTRKLALVLLVVGCLCLPAPLYLGWVADATAPPPKTSQVYVAEPVDPANESDRDVILSHATSTVALSVHQVSHRYSAGEYRAPNATNRLLDAAMADGAQTVRDPAVRADVARIERNYTFVYDAYGGTGADGDDERYYRLRVDENASRVEATPVSTERVVSATVEREAVRYGRLTPVERETVDAILNASSGDGFGHRPRVDDAFVDELPALVWKEGTLYSLRVGGHADDFGPGVEGFFAGLLVAGVGVVLALVGGLLYAREWWRERRAAG